MKYCEFAYEYLYLDSPNGDVYLCPWMDPKTSKIGNLFEEDIDKIWNNEIANKLRDSHTNNCFNYCRLQACPHLQNNDLPEIDNEEEYRCLTATRKYPTNINLAYDFICNQSCETCRSSVFIPENDYAQKIEILQNKIAPLLNKAKKISASGHGDPFASPYMMNLLSNLHPENKDLSIQLETNGVFFDEEHWDKIKHLADFDLRVIVTVNSYDRFTYQHISRGGNYDKLQHNLKFISELRSKNYLKNFMVALVTQDRNFREIPSFVEYTFNNFNVDKILLRPVYQWGTMPEKTFWFKDVLNPKHPYHAEYLEILQHPVLKDERVYNFGGDMDHPARDFYIEEPNVCSCEDMHSVSPAKKSFAHLASCFIPVKSIRKKLREKILYGNK